MGLETRNLPEFAECSYEVIFCDGKSTEVRTKMTIIDAAVDGCIKTGHNFSEIRTISRKDSKHVTDATVHAGH